MKKNKIDNVLITRQPEQSIEFINLLSSNGYFPFLLPMIKTVELKYTIKNKAFDYLVFTSANSIKYFLKDIKKINYGQIVTVGAKTSEFAKEHGLKTDIIPKVYSSEGLIQHFRDKEIQGMKFLIPGPKKRTETFKNFLVSKNAVVEAPAVYKTQHVNYDEGFVDNFIINNKIDCVTFASPSAAEGFLKNSSSDIKIKHIISIGQTTYKYLKSHGISSEYPARYTVENIVSLINEINKS
jgi:uroporphyrinogen-III synthase